MMHFATYAVSATLLLFVADDAKENAAKSDVKKLQGTWTMAALEVDGKNVDADKIKNTTLEIKDDKYIVKTEKNKYEVRFQLDPAKKPREIDLYFPDPPNADKVHRGIYLIDGDTFKMCKAQAADQPRPTDFGTWPDTGIFMVTWKRKPPE